MATEKQIEANRRNALKSTGPKTGEGKARSRRNAVKHGALARVVVGELEDAQEFQGLHRDLIDHYRPCTRVEEILVERLATALWRDRRVTIFEKQYFDKMAESAAPRVKLFTQERVTFHAPSAAKTEELLKLGRYTVMITREIDRLIRMIEREQARSRGMVDVTPRV